MCIQYYIAFLWAFASLAACDAGQEFTYDQHFSTKTPYWSQQDPATWTPPPATCTPVLVEAVIRHGARNPGKGDIKKLGLLQELMRV
jgi:hypothetical protein